LIRTGAAVAIVGGAISAELEGADVAEGAAVLAAGVGIQRPVEEHALDGVEGGLALDLEVFDVGEPRLRSLHGGNIEQMFAH